MLGSSPMTFYCPHCGKALSPRVLAALLGAKGGAATGPAKSRGTEHARKAARARWDKVSPAKLQMLRLLKERDSGP